MTTTPRRDGIDGGGFAPSTCAICGLEGPPRRLGNLVAAESTRWIVRHHAHPAPLAGWMLLCSRRHVQGPARLEVEEAAEFGRALRDVASAVERTSEALRVYAIAFGEGSQHLHVHLVPRHASLPETAAWKIADWYRAVERGERAPASAADVDSAVAAVRTELLASRGADWRAPSA